MAAGALGSVSNRLRHENGDTHVVDCDDVFSDAGSTPAASTIFPKENEQISSFVPPPPKYLHGVRFPSRAAYGCIQCRRTQVHVALRRREVLMSRNFLNRPGRRAAIARCEQNVCRRMCTPCCLGDDDQEAGVWFMCDRDGTLPV